MLPKHNNGIISGNIDENGNVSEINIVLDSGAFQSIVYNEVVNNLKLNNVEPTTWTTVAGKFSTWKQTTIVFSLPMLHEIRTIETLVHVSTNLENYATILGRDLLQELGIILNFHEATIQW